MKKSIKIAAIALIAMATAVACNNNNTPEEPIDTLPIDTVVEEPIDSTAIEEVVVDEPQKPAKKATAKKTTVEVKKNNNDRPIEIEVKNVSKRTADQTQNMQTSTKDPKETDRPVEIKAKTKIGNKSVNLSVSE